MATSGENSCARYELPAEAFENVYKVFDSIERAAGKQDWQLVRDACRAGRSQLRSLVVCLD